MGVSTCAQAIRDSHAVFHDCHPSADTQRGVLRIRVLGSHFVCTVSLSHSKRVVESHFVCTVSLSHSKRVVGFHFVCTVSLSHSKRVVGVSLCLHGEFVSF